MQGASELGGSWVVKSSPAVKSASQARQGGGQATSGGGRNGTSKGDALDRKVDWQHSDRVKDRQGNEAYDLSDEGGEQYQANDQGGKHGGNGVGDQEEGEEGGG